MDINLSDEMVEKIVCTAWGRAQSLKKTIMEQQKEEPTTQRGKARKNLLIKSLRESLQDAEEVHSTFLELLNQV